MAKKITVIGLGGVGGYFGYKIAKWIQNHPGDELTYVARGETYEVVKKVGLTLISSEHDNLSIKPNRLIRNFSEIDTSDLLLLCVKDYDLQNVCEELKSIVRNNTILLALMNGVDIYERIRKVIKNGVVLPACVYVASHIREKGIVEHTGKTGRIIVGKDPQHKTVNVKWVIQIMRESGAEITFKENALPDIWEKFLFIASFGLVSARHNKQIGEILHNACLKTEVTKIINELLSITERFNLNFTSDIISRIIQKAETFPYHTPTSLQLDVWNKKQNTELDLFSGAILNYGKSFNIDTPETQKIDEEIKSILKS